LGLVMGGFRGGRRLMRIMMIRVLTCSSFVETNASFWSFWEEELVARVGWLK